MRNSRGEPSTWLLHNSSGYPDFLFTILSYSMLLLIFVALIWITFGILVFIHAGSTRAVVMIKVMESMKTGLLSLAGVVFGLAGSYTVRRYKKDQQNLEMKKMGLKVGTETQQTDGSKSIQENLRPVQNEEDI